MENPGKTRIDMREDILLKYGAYAFRGRYNKGKGLTLDFEGECIVCTSHTPNADGYIRMFLGIDAPKRYEFLHRSVFILYKGEIPDGYEIDHKCRNRKCCNPDHLQLLSIRDHKVKTNKERYALRTEGIILAIEMGFPNKLIAESFGVTVHTVNRHKRLLKGN